MKYLYEFIGTFFLVLTVGMTVLNGLEAWAPFAIGAVLGVMVYAGAHISGGHYNPAVSLAVFLRKKLERDDMFKYWGAQFLGALLAALITWYFKGTQSPVALQMDHFKALLAEFLFTFALCYVVLNVATTRATNGNSYFGWAIGFTVLAGAYAVGAVSNAAFNPAVALGLSVLNLTHWADLWVYIIAGVLGAAAAAYVVNEAHPEEGVSMRPVEKKTRKAK